MASETFRIAIDATVNDNTGPGVQSAQKRLSGFDKSIEHTKGQLDRLTSTGFHIDLDAVDRATATIQNVETKVHGFVGKAWNFTVGVIDKATAPLQGIINLAKNPILQAGAIFGVSVSLADTVKTYGDFESAMSNVKAISGATGEEFEKLNAKAKEEGATTAFTATQSAEAFGYMAMAGWKTEDMLNGIDGIMSLAAASGEDLATTSDIVTDALTAFGLQASDSGHFADVLAQASANANTNVGMMGESFKYVAPVAGALKYSVEDVSLALGLMANASVKGSMAGTSLKTSLANLAAPTDKMQGAMDKYGISLTKRNGEMRTLHEVLDNLRSSLGGLSETEQTAAASTIFGKEAMAGMLAIINASEDDYNKLTAAVNNADGASQQMADTMLDNMNGSFTLLRSAVDGAKIALGERFSPYLREFATWITGKMPLVEDAIGDAMDHVDAKVEDLRQTIAEFTASDEWANADIWGKLGIAWDKIVAEPFDEWWNGSGRQFFADRAAGLGRGLGSGITAGFLALLGIDPAGAIDDGTAIGANFVSGFMDGLDFDVILDSLKTWAEGHKGQVAAIGAILGFKLVTGAASAYSKLRGLTAALGLGGSSDTGTGASGLPSMGGSFKTSAAVMNVTAQMVVLKSGNFGSEAGSKVSQAAETAFSGSTGTSLIPSTGTPAAAGALPSATRLLGDGKATFEGTAVEIDPATLPAKSLTSANSWLGKLLQKGSTQATINADGTLTSVTGGIGGTLGTVGTALGSHATTAAGTAAAGSAGILGGLLGLLGIGAGVRNLYRGTQTTGKDAQNEYSKGGTKIGMVGAGAAAGAAVGSVVPVVGTGVGALVGAGIGGLGALGFGDKIGQALSDALDEGGALDNLKQTVGTFFTSTLPEHWTSFWDGVGTTFSETIPYAIGYAMGKTKVFFTNTLPEHWTAFWDGVGEFWTEDVPAWVESTGEKAGVFFTETLPTKWTDFWTGVGDFWTKEVPAWVESSASKAAEFFIVTLPAKWTGFWSGVGDKISGFFTNAKNAFGSGFSAGSFATGGGTSNGGGGGRVTPHAMGGIMTSPHVGLVAEDGPEAIIPLGGSRRTRALDLWNQTGSLLGADYSDDSDNDTPENVPTFSPVVYPAPAQQAPAGAVAQPISIPVEIGLNPQFIIQGTAGMSPDEIIATVKSRIREMVDDISDELAERLARVLANMPA